MSIIDDGNFIFKKALAVADATTGQDITHYFYDDVKNGKEISSR